ncbi:MAG: hypothetical protein WAU24_04060 [Chitinophagaceae bacterium]
MQPRAIVLFAMDYKVWNRTFRKELMKGDAQFKSWFLDNAYEIEISDNVYNEVFIKNPIISTGITNTLLNESQHQFKDLHQTEKIYFVLNADSYKRILKIPFYADFKSPQIDLFSTLLDDISKNKIYVIVEYIKKYGWFDFEKINAQRQLFIKKHEIEIKENEKRLNKTNKKTF